MSLVGISLCSGSVRHGEYLELAMLYIRSRTGSVESFLSIAATWPCWFCTELIRSGAAARQDTRFVEFCAHIFHSEEGLVPFRLVSRNDGEVLLVLVKAMTGTYPVQVYLT